jgi:hypothetical protein
VVEVRCTDTLLALDALLDEASAAEDAAERASVCDAMRRIRCVAAALSRVKEAAVTDF